MPGFANVAILLLRGRVVYFSRLIRLSKADTGMIGWLCSLDFSEER